VRHIKKNKKSYSIIFHILVLIFIILPGSTSPLSAAVTGACSNCHTMHDSQNGGGVARGGSGVGWNGSGQLTGGSTQGPQSQLLITGCVGCHSSTTSSTIINFGGSKIPIVYNTVQPTTPLAGGNFYWVAQGGEVNDTKGHNVYGISGVDANLNKAPGGMPCLTGGCHISLAASSDTGCKGCHTSTAHHDDSKPWYRFLLSDHSEDESHVLKTNVKPSGAPGEYISNEDPDWEYTKSATDHNYYQGQTGPFFSEGISYMHSITAFCYGCHRTFHVITNEFFTSPWLRHPIGILLPDSGEYAGYDPVSNYSTEAPVAWTNPASPSRATAVVMCLSCHRAHGSDQPDMLRWDYSTMIVGGGGTGGCFTCHTTKK